MNILRNTELYTSVQWVDYMICESRFDKLFFMMAEEERDKDDFQV